MRDLYKFICTHSLAVVCGETSDRNPNEPKLQAVKITDGKRSDTMSAALTESEIRKVVDFLADCTIIGYGAPLNFFRKLCSQYNIQYSLPADAGNRIRLLPRRRQPALFLCKGTSILPVSPRHKGFATLTRVSGVYPARRGGSKMPFAAPAAHRIFEKPRQQSGLYFLYRRY